MATYSFLEVDMIVDGVPLLELKQIQISLPNEKWATTADNNSGSVIYTKNAAHKVGEITIAVDQTGIANDILTGFFNSEATVGYMIKDNNGRTVIVGEGKVNASDVTFSNDPNDKNWKIMGRIDVFFNGGNS